MALAELAELLAEPLVVLDVGCRWGFADAWEQLGDKALVTGFEPDVEEAERLRERYRERPWVCVEPFGLGRTSGPATLYVTKEPAQASLYRPDPAIRAEHRVLAGMEVDHEITIELTTLDEWAAGAGVEHADVIKLDTQGSELDVLEGGTRLLSTIRGVECEVQLNPAYEGVPLFADVDRFLRAVGFVLWRLKTMAHYGLREAPEVRFPVHQQFDEHRHEVLGHGGQLSWADAFYVRADMARPDPAAGWESLARDALIAAALGFPDLAGATLLAARDSAPGDVVVRVTSAYDRVVA